MKPIIIAALALALAGCGAGRQLNPGAAVPVTLTAQGRIAAMSGRPGDTSVLGAYDRERKAIYIASGLGTAKTLEVWTAEYDHLIDDVGSVDTAAALVSGPTWHPVCADSPPMRRAMATAAIEAARRQP